MGRLVLRFFIWDFETESLRTVLGHKKSDVFIASGGLNGRGVHNTLRKQDGLRPAETRTPTEPGSLAEREGKDESTLGRRRCGNHCTGRQRPNGNQ